VSWGAIGARTTESQVHRELASGLSVPVGFKNGTDGSVQIAIDALKAVSEPHHFLSVTKQGLSAIVCTSGNSSCHIILRGGAQGPNYAPEHVSHVHGKLKQAGINSRIMIDCSHGNSQKDHRKQRLVAESIIEQISGDDTENCHAICGVMIESNLVEGRQNINSAADLSSMTYGQSVTDACLGWEETVVVLDRLRAGVQQRRTTI
jgi:3-deoxy-7-phosphoheptulonate synthase